MEILETEVEIKYLKLALKSLEIKRDSLYAHSPVKMYHEYAFQASKHGLYSHQEEKRLEREADKWSNEVEDGIEYSDVCLSMSALQSLIDGLEHKQSEKILMKYNVVT